MTCRNNTISAIQWPEFVVKGVGMGMGVGWKRKETMALRVSPKPQKCNVSNHGIGHRLYTLLKKIKGTC